METELWPHPACPALTIERDISVIVERLSPTILCFRYVVYANVDELIVSPPAAPLRTDNLWKTTCFEAFLAPEGATSYRELNFSPSSQWAAYDFADYRRDMAQAALPGPPDIEVEHRPDHLALTATVSIDLPDEPYRLGLAAVIEERGGRKSYWAASHAEEPDFHRRHCFVLQLPAAKPA